jgi:hypothetical protein
MTGKPETTGARAVYLRMADDPTRTAQTQADDVFVAAIASLTDFLCHV